MPGLPRWASQWSLEPKVRDVARTGNASGDDNDVGILEGRLGALVGGEVAGCFLRRQLSVANLICPGGGRTHRVGGDVREVGGNTGGVDNIVEGELIDERGELQEQGQGLWRVD